MTMKRLLTIKDLCGLIGISRRTVYRLRVAGELPPPIRIGKCNRWDAEVIDRWLHSDRGVCPFRARVEQVTS